MSTEPDLSESRLALISELDESAAMSGQSDEIVVDDARTCASPLFNFGLFLFSASSLLYFVSKKVIRIQHKNVRMHIIAISDTVEIKKNTII